MQTKIVLLVLATLGWNSAFAAGLARKPSQSLSIESHAVYQEQQHIPVAIAVAPPLTSNNDTCMGSISVGASTVSIGLSVGGTWTDKNCMMLKNSRELWNMGFKGAAVARMCMDHDNHEALESTGIKCPQRR